MRLIVATAVAFLVAVASLGSAGAQDGEIGGEIDEQSVGEVYGTVRDDRDKGGADEKGGGGGSTGDEAKAAWELYLCGPPAWQPGYSAFLSSSPDLFVARDGTRYDAYTVFCSRGNGAVTQWDPWLVPVYDPVVDAIVTLDGLLVELTARVVAPVPVIAMSPPVDHFQVVGIWGWFWVDPDSYEEQVETAGDPAELSVTLSAVPGELRFYPGDDAVTGVEAVITCEGPGVAWYSGLDDDATDCKHFWDWPSKWDPSGLFTTRAEADYEFTWVASGRLTTYLPAVTGTLGVTTVASADTPVTVIELQAVGG